jgi:hypothetical protein
MVTVTRKIRQQRLVSIIRTLTSWCHLRRGPAEPADGWFTLQSEPGEGSDREPAAPAKLRDPRAHRGNDTGALPTVRSPRSVRHGHAWRCVSIVAKNRRMVAAIAVTGALAVGATLAALDSHNTGGSALLVAQRAKVAQLAAQREQALAAAQHAQTSQAAWRARAIRWRSRALRDRRRPGRRSARGRQRSRPRRRRTEG